MSMLRISGERTPRSAPRARRMAVARSITAATSVAACGMLGVMILTPKGIASTSVSPSLAAERALRIRDVPASSADYQAVQAIVGRGILSPYSAGAFGGHHAVTRYEFAAALYRTLKPLIDAMPDAPACGEPFADVPQSNPAAAAVEILHEKGIAPGYPNRRFKGRRAVSRYEMAAALYAALKPVLSEIPVSRPGVRLVDVPPGEPAAPAVAALAARDILADRDGAFDGNRAATRYELAHALYAVLQKLPAPVGIGAATLEAPAPPATPPANTPVAQASPPVNQHTAVAQSSQSVNPHTPLAQSSQSVTAKDTVAQASPAETPEIKLNREIHPHEIEIKGAVTAVYTGERKLVVSVTSIKMPDGVITRLAPPREKTVLIDDQTVFDPSVSAAKPVSFVTMLRGARVLAIGPDRGVGKPLPARIIVLDKKTR